MLLKSAVIVPLLLIVTAVAQAAGDDEFTVGDIKIEGLQRISEGTVYNYLPVNIGDKLDTIRAAGSAACPVRHGILP